MGKVFSFRQPQNCVLSLVIKATLDMLISCPSQFLCLVNFLYIFDAKKDCCKFIFLWICTSQLAHWRRIHPLFFSQWDLVCDRKSLSRITAIIFFLGVMFGALAFGYLSDKYAVSVVMEQLTWRQALTIRIPLAPSSVFLHFSSYF